MNCVIQISFGKNFIRISDSFKSKFIQFLIQLIMSFKLVLEKIIRIFRVFKFYSRIIQIIHSTLEKNLTDFFVISNFISQIIHSTLEKNLTDFFVISNFISRIILGKNFELFI